MSYKFVNRVVEWQRKKLPEWFRLLAIVVFPPIFISLILGPGIFLYERVDELLGFPRILPFPTNEIIGFPIFLIGVFLYTLFLEPAVFTEIVRFVRLVPRMLARRRLVLSRAIVSAHEMHSWFR